jgi:hypothetical protein
VVEHVGRLARKVTLVGGPLDGEFVPASTHAFQLLQGQIYQLRNDGNYVWCGYQAWVCAGCGGYITPPAGTSISYCQLCGEPRGE